MSDHRFSIIFLAATGALFGACDFIDKPIAELEPYEPCADKECGDPCTVCDPDDKDCVETQVLKVCDADAMCVSEVPDLCEGPPAYEPCADKQCGDACTQCDPNDPDCAEDAVLKACDGQGQCVPETEELCEYVPCAGKQCGDACTLCDPNDPDCVEDQVIRACDAEGECVPDTQDLCL